MPDLAIRLAYSMMKNYEAFLENNINRKKLICQWVWYESEELNPEITVQNSLPEI